MITASATSAPRRDVHVAFAPIMGAPRAGQPLAQTAITVGTIIGRRR
jgi:hypothetical protein